MKKSSQAKPVWSRQATSQADAERCIAYCAGRDMTAKPMADAALLPHDLQTNRAHCAMLCRCGIITPARLASIARGLGRIEKDHAKGVFKLDPALEDVHINVERAVARSHGERAAGAMHTARSRNDQCATDIRLWMRDELIRAVQGVADLIGELAALGLREARTVMAGWTHGQPAMPTTLGHWAAAHGYALSRDLQALRDLWPMINCSPLGAAAGFGSSWPIDRQLTAKLLGFDGPQTNSLDCVSTRWEAEARMGSALALLMAHLSSLGQDIYRLSSPPRHLIALDPAFTTGSSIMPQKRNPDFTEVTRARAASVQALASALAGTGRGALSGYNRDSQWTKYWILDLADEVHDAPEIFARVMATLTPDPAALAADAGEDFVVAVDLADFIASSRSIEFRRLYHLIGEAVAADRVQGVFRLETVNALMKKAGIGPPLSASEFRKATSPVRTVARRASLGGPAPASVREQVRELRRIAKDGDRWAAQRRRQIAKARDRLKRTISDLVAGRSKA